MGLDMYLHRMTATRKQITEVGYWRKANAIHKWFVDNVQDGVDDCGDYEVSEEHIQKLLQTCKTVVTNGKLDKEKAQTLLPPQAGFFFGSTDIDEGYEQDLLHTISILEPLQNFDFKRNKLLYCSSW